MFSKLFWVCPFFFSPLRCTKGWFEVDRDSTDMSSDSLQVCFLTNTPVCIDVYSVRTSFASQDSRSCLKLFLKPSRHKWLCCCYMPCMEANQVTKSHKQNDESQSFSINSQKVASQTQWITAVLTWGYIIQQHCIQKKLLKCTIYHKMLFLLGKSDVLHFEKFTQLSAECVVLNHTMTSVGGRLLRKIARI